MNSKTPDPRPFLVRFARHRDESMLGYASRLAAANGYSVGLLLALLKEMTGEMLDSRNYAGLAYRPLFVTQLEHLSGRKLSDAAWRQLDSAAGRYFVVAGAALPEGALMTHHAQVCPCCLCDAGYLREEWDLAGVTVCCLHHVVLIDECPACQKQLGVLRDVPHQCSACFFDLRQAPVAKASEEEVRLADYFAALATYRLRTASDVHVDHPDSLFGIAHSMSFSCTEVLDGRSNALHFQKLSITQRRRALQSMLPALDGNLLDGITLHSHLQKHVDHRAPYLPAHLTTQPLSQFLIQNAFLSPQARGILSYGTAAPRAEGAASYFGGRPPQFQSVDEVCAFLGCSEEQWTWLVRHQLIEKPSGQLGFDADQVLAAQNRLSEFLTLDALDRVLGVDGLAERLVEWNVLVTGTSARDDWQAIDLRSLAVVLDDLRALSEESQTRQGDYVLLVDTEAGRTNFSEACALLLSRARRRDLGGLRWRPPYRMTDLLLLLSDVPRLDAAVVAVANDESPVAHGAIAKCLS